MPRLQFKEDIDSAVTERSPLPEGWYKGHLVESYFQDFKNGNGVSLVFNFVIDNGGIPRRIRSFNTWRHKTSTEAEKWGQVSVKQFLRACGKPDAQSTEECHNVPLEILVVPEGEKYNRVKAFRKPSPNGKEGVVLSSPPYSKPKEAEVNPDVLDKHAQSFADDDVPF
jgi:hypothetical protein